MSYELLSEPLRRYIRDKRWEEFRPIQAAAISKLLTTSENYILASKTASGKTEAAFLPILSMADFSETGIQVLYISPLIALINDQLDRVEELCKYIDVPVTKWHGETKQSIKNKVIKEPRGIMLITPESLEAMFVNRPYYVDLLFSNLKFVIVDEIHSFIGTGRGIQLKSILSRLRDRNKVPFRIVGLSATIGDYVEAKRFTGDEQNTKVLLDRTAKEMQTHFFYFDIGMQTELPVGLLKSLYTQVCNSKSLIFPNSRGRVEEIAVKLQKISDQVGGHGHYFAHHSSVDREVREYVEFFAKQSKRKYFSIVCTSTLELGIDIGAIDRVVQIDATHSVSSLIQRVGRSGRKGDTCSQLFLYATTSWSLLQSLACWNLHQHEFIEPPQVINAPYDILAHQAVSIVKSVSGVDYVRLVRLLHSNYAFQHIAEKEMMEIVDFLVDTDVFERLGNELIIGIEGEKVVNNKEFYSVFQREKNFTVVFNSKSLGGLPLTPQIEVDQNVLLAAKIWKIKEIDLKAGKIYVVPAKDGKKPVFIGSGGQVDKSIREEMFRILMSRDEFDILDQNGCNVLHDLRKQFAAFAITGNFDRPFVTDNQHLKFYLFTGTCEMNALKYLLEQTGLKVSVGEDECALIIEGVEENFFCQKWQSLLELRDELDKRLAQSLKQMPSLMNFSKWAFLIPQKYQVRLLKERLYHFDNAFKLVSTLRMKKQPVK